MTGSLVSSQFSYLLFILLLAESPLSISDSHFLDSDIILSCFLGQDLLTFHSKAILTYFKEYKFNLGTDVRRDKLHFQPFSEGYKVCDCASKWNSHSQFSSLEVKWKRVAYVHTARLIPQGDLICTACCEQSLACLVPQVMLRCFLARFW